MLCKSMYLQEIHKNTLKDQDIRGMMSATFFSDGSGKNSPGQNTGVGGHSLLQGALKKKKNGITVKLNAGHSPTESLPSGCSPHGTKGTLKGWGGSAG